MTENDSVKVRFLSSFCQHLTNKDIKIGLVHGLQDQPFLIGRDFDFLVSRKHETRATSAAADFFKANCSSFYHHYNPVGVHQYLGWIAGHGGQLLHIEIDIITRLRLRWGPLVFNNLEEPTRQLAPTLNVPYYPWAGFYKHFLIKFLAGCWRSLENTRGSWGLAAQDHAIIRNRLAYWFGKRLSAKIFAAALSGNLTKLKLIHNTVRLRLLLKTFATPLGFFYWPKEELARIFYASPGAPSVAIVGPDGVGKSTVIKQLSDCFTATTCYPRITLKHWRPHLFPPISRLLGRRQLNHNSPMAPRRSSGAFQYFRLFYYALDFWIGWWFKDRLASNSLTVILYDRCFLDMVVDPLRFGIKSNKLAAHIGRFLKRPDYIFALASPPEDVLKRKRELGSHEIAVQNHAWLQLYSLNSIDAVVEVKHGSPEVASKQIFDHICTNGFTPKSLCYKAL
jgi:thymidylate kinase